MPRFSAEIQRWEPQEMVDIFAQVGARYVVLTTKHHDGFLLWPSATSHPRKQNYHAARDIVGELTQAVKDRGLRMGVYYSGALGWSFNAEPIDSIVAMLDNGPVETDKDHISVTDLIHSFVDIVSKNGNLLLSVGPMAGGTIPEPQLERLRGLGAWLDVNGEAIFGTRPWGRAEGTTTEGIPVRFTRKDGYLYAIILGAPSGEVTITDLRAAGSATVHLLGHDTPLKWEQRGANLTLRLPSELVKTCARAICVRQ